MQVLVFVFFQMFLSDSVSVCIIMFFMILSHYLCDGTAVCAIHMDNKAQAV